MHLYPLCILYTDWQFGNTLNGTFVNKYAWDSICKYSTFQLVSFLLFLLFLSQNAWFFFLRLICCFVINFSKNERACLFKSLHYGIFVEVGLPFFQGLHFHSNIALSKNLELYFSSLVILISSHL